MLEVECPAAETVRLSLGSDSPQDGASSMDQQHPEIGIPAFTDAAQTPTTSVGVFPRCQTEIASEVATRGKTCNIADKADQCRGGK